MFHKFPDWFLAKRDVALRFEQVVKDNHTNDPREFIITEPDICVDVILKWLEKHYNPKDGLASGLPYVNSNFTVVEAISGDFGVKVQHNLVQTQIMTILKDHETIDTIRITIPDKGIFSISNDRAKAAEDARIVIKKAIDTNLNVNVKRKRDIKIHIDIVDMRVDYWVFTSVYRMCIDGRLFVPNIISCLISGQYPLVFGNAGSVALLAGDAGIELKEMKDFVANQLINTLKITQIRNVILINHHKCAFYRSVLEVGLNEEILQLAKASSNVIDRLANAGIFNVKVQGLFQLLNLVFLRDIRIGGISPEE